MTNTSCLWDKDITLKSTNYRDTQWVNGEWNYPSLSKCDDKKKMK